MKTESPLVPDNTIYDQIHHGDRPERRRLPHFRRTRPPEAVDLPKQMEFDEILIQLPLRKENAKREWEKRNKTGKNGVSNNTLLLLL